MATYTYSALFTTNTTITLPSSTVAFSTSDQLIFDNEISANDLTLSTTGTGATLSLTITVGANTITFNKFTQNKITSTNFIFADGSQLLIGDNTSATSNDDSTTVGNILISTDGDDYIDGMKGSNDTVSYATASSSVEIALGAPAVPPSVLVPAGEAADAAAIPANSGSGSDRVFNIENIIGSVYSDKLTGTDGKNKLDGGLGMDTLIGGLDDDTYVITAGDIVTENSEESITGSGTDTIISNTDYVLAANVEKLTLTGLAIYGTGNALNNTITGTSANNILDGFENITSLIGGNGVDTLIGGAGNDTYIVRNLGDIVNESITGSAGIDSVQAFVTFELSSNVENLRLMAADNIDGKGNSLNNIIYANRRNNLLDGGSGTDTLSYQFGATSGVTITAGETEAAETGGSGTDSATKFENIIGSRFNDKITGSTEENVLTGGLGNDTLVGAGATKNDTLDGGAGNDTYELDDTAYTIIDTAGNDTIKSSIDFSISGFSNIENLTANSSESGSTGITLTGNILANTLESNTKNDTLEGGTGNDTYKITSTGDVVTELANAGIDTVITSFTGYTLKDNLENLTLAGVNGSGVSIAIKGTGNSLANIITASAKNDSLFGGAGNDKLVGGLGNNTLDGESNNDIMIGGKGNDTYIVDSTSDIVTEISGEGFDTIKSGVTYTLSDNVEYLTLTGTGVINGTGNTLDNIMTGNKSNNILKGGSGSDTFVFLASGGNGSDTISDFVTGDKLNLDAPIVGTGAVATAISSASAAIAATTALPFSGTVQVISTNGAAGNLTTDGTATLIASDLKSASLSNLANYLGEHWLGDSSATTTETGVIIINSAIGTDSNAYIYQWDNDNQANAINADELELIGTVTSATIATTDISISAPVVSTGPTATTTLVVTDSVGSITGQLTTAAKTDDTSLALSGVVTGTLASGELIAIYDGSDVKLGTATVSSGTWTYTSTGTTGLANGATVTYKAVVEDASSNQGTFSSTFTATIDTTAPTVAANGLLLVNDAANGNLTLTFSEDLIGFDSTKISLVNVASPGTAIAAASTELDGVVTIDPTSATALATGASYDVTVASGFATDVAGNAVVVIVIGDSPDPVTTAF